VTNPILVNTVDAWQQVIQPSSEKPINRDLMQDGTIATPTGPAVNAWLDAISKPVTQEVQIQDNVKAAQSWLDTIAASSKASQ